MRPPRSKRPNEKSRPPRWLGVTAVLFLAALFGRLSLGQLAAQEMQLPPETPNAERAISVYETRCASCHGLTGRGDGELAAQSPVPPAVFANPDYRLTAVPADMFETITNGRMTAGMPLFGPGSSNPLSNQQIWDLIALIYSFSTPPQTVAAGEMLLNEQLNEALPAEWLDFAFWSQHSNEMMWTNFSESQLISADLAPADQVAVIDYLRTLTYEYVDVSVLNEPIEAAVIRGQIANGTTENPVGGLPVSLRGFTMDLVETINMSTTAAPDGTFEFDLTSIPPDWVFFVSADYNGYRFNSAPGQISRQRPQTSMPITVFDTSSDTSNVVIDHLEVFVDFIENGIQVSELYRFSHLAPTIFTGVTGNPSQGTTQISLPAGASNINFQRSMGASLNFAPAPEFISVSTGWADTRPLQPGQASSQILVTYELPYQSGMLLAHPLNYSLNSASLFIVDAGVTASGPGWLEHESQVGAAGSFLNYVNVDLTNAEALTVNLSGRPQIVRDAAGNSIQPRNEQAELLIGAVGILVAGIFLAIAFRPQPAATANAPTANGLLQTIADMDDAFENGRLSKTVYQQQRSALKAELIDIMRRQG